MIGIFGGTFDPIHFGHLRPALELLEDLEFQEIRFVPCNVPPHRQMPIAAAHQRLRMLEVALRHEPRLVVDQRELLREGPSYMVDTLESLRAELGNTPLCLIVGMDAFSALHTWHRWQDLPGLAHIVVADRPGSARPVGDVAQLLEHRRAMDRSELVARASGRILPWPVSQLEISSSAIRDLLRRGRSARFLLPDTVIDLIHTEGIYV